MRAITFARESGIPFLGVCLGMQAAVIEYCRAFLNKPLANSKEFSPEISDDDSGNYINPNPNPFANAKLNIFTFCSNYFHARGVERNHGWDDEVRCTQDPSRRGFAGDGYLQQRALR